MNDTDNKTAAVPAMTKQAQEAWEKGDPLAEARKEAADTAREMLNAGTLTPLAFDDILLDAGFDGDPMEVLAMMI